MGEGYAKSEEWVAVKHLGEGSQGTVRLAKSTQSGRLFAVKSAAKETWSESCLRKEYEILSKLNCPHIIECLGDETSEGEYRVFLEYMEGGSLGDLVTSSFPLPEGLLSSYTLQMLTALSYLHGQGIVHGDIKGKNVLVGLHGNVKLADFGCSKKIGDKFCMGGTPLWMAPEVVNCEQQGPPSDVWCVGCTVLELATGKKPWSELFPRGDAPLTAMDVLFQIGRSKDVPNINGVGLSETTEDFLSKCLVRDPAQRWTCEQLLQHPFVTRTSLAPLSPTSVFHFSNTEWDSFSTSACSSINVESLNNNNNGEILGDRVNSANQRLQILAYGFELGPHAQERKSHFFHEIGSEWILVRGNQTTLPTDCSCANCHTLDFGIQTQYLEDEENICSFIVSSENQTEFTSSSRTEHSPQLRSHTNLYFSLKENCTTILGKFNPSTGKICDEERSNPHSIRKSWPIGHHLLCKIVCKDCQVISKCNNKMNGCFSKSTSIIYLGELKGSITCPFPFDFNE